MNKVIINLLADLRKWLIVAFSTFIFSFIFCYLNKTTLYSIISQPIKQYYQSQHIHINDIFIFTGIWEIFIADIKLCLYSSFFLSLPVFLYCIYKFLSPSLYKNEKQIALLTFSTIIILTILAIIAMYSWILPKAIVFFLSQTNNIAQPMLSISEYLTAFFGLIFAFCLVFQIPIILFTLTKLHIISIKQLTKHRKTIIVGIFIISAIITPPDISSQIFCAILLIIIYELTLFFIRITTNHKAHKSRIAIKTKRKQKTIETNKSKRKSANNKIK